MKESVVVYALGNHWKQNRKEIAAGYDIIACSDRDPNTSERAGDYKFVEPEKLCELSFDKIIFGCLKKEGLRERIALQYHIPPQKIFYYEEIFGDCGRKQYVEKREHAEKITVVIPTYNRQKRLGRTLDLLQMQTDQDFNVIILDNCSDYDVYSVVKDREQAFRDRVTIVRNRINIGMPANVANCFAQEVDGWLWALTDDDLPSVYAIQDIYEEIESSTGIGVINFCICGCDEYLPQGYQDFGNLHEMLGFYRDSVIQGQDINAWNSDFLYLSNKVYNMKYVFKYCGEVIMYAYCAGPHVLPILYLLNAGEASVRLTTKRIITYDAYDLETGPGWNYIKTLSGMRIISDIPLDLDEMERCTLYQLLIHMYQDSLLEDVTEESFEYDLWQIEKLYYEILDFCLSDDEKENFLRKLETIKKKKCYCERVMDLGHQRIRGRETICRR